ncbi:hypothetical protein BST85_09810 [Aureitalea marina]|uniref:RDD domain-containing protein n=1 Tax=Aureitalea marina TaxID=930804 RepID=A0A2S7KRD3_9FLAO|nr:hypothetical protein BST85_09810 [Aureitalea marina]
MIIDMLIVLIGYNLLINLLNITTEERHLWHLRIKIYWKAILLGCSYLFYFWLMDVFLAGKTLGKTLLKIRVVSSEGLPLTWKTRLIRTVLKVIGILILPVAAVLFLWARSFTVQDQVLGTRAIR